MDRLIPLIIILPLPLAAFWLWMARDMARNDSLSDSEKINWVFLFIFLNNLRCHLVLLR
jgi:hypothetical protein